MTTYAPICIPLRVRPEVSALKLSSSPTVSNIPSQVSNSVKRVEGERHGEDELEAALQPNRHRLHQFNQVCGVDGGDDGVKEVSHRRSVHQDGEAVARDSVRNREKPCDLVSDGPE